MTSERGFSRGAGRVIFGPCVPPSFSWIACCRSLPDRVVHSAEPFFEKLDLFTVGDDPAYQLYHIPGIVNPDLLAYQCVLRADGGRWDVPFGFDEHMLGALAMGARGAVGSGFNFAAPIYQRLLRAFAAGDLPAAREEQFRSVQLIQFFVRHGYMGAAKATMRMLGVNVAPPPA